MQNFERAIGLYYSPTCVIEDKFLHAYVYICYPIFKIHLKKYYHISS